MIYNQKIPLKSVVIKLVYDAVKKMEKHNNEKRLERLGLLFKSKNDTAE
jgi:hypothetical protein